EQASLIPTEFLSFVKRLIFDIFLWKNLKTIAWLIGTYFCVTTASGQVAFKNLDFELAQVTPETDWSLPFSNALPNWRGAVAGLAATQALYEVIPLYSAQIGIYDTNAFPPIFGNFSVFLAADAGPDASDDADLFQTGLIPNDVKTIRFATTLHPLMQAIGL